MTYDEWRDYYGEPEGPGCEVCGEEVVIDGDGMYWCDNCQADREATPDMLQGPH